jgi:hypothetical protein
MFKKREQLDTLDDMARKKYSTIFTLFLVIVVVLVLWVISVAIGIYTLGMGPYWAYLSLDNWIYIVIILVAVFIVMELILYFHYKAHIIPGQQEERGKPTKEYLHGKRIYEYTYPDNFKGGLFSKTYIQIDEENVLRLRTLIVPPDKL